MKKNPPLMAQIGTLFLTWRRYQQKELLPHKLTLKQLYVLRQLSRKDFLSPSEIADMLYCDRPTATVILDNLQREKWITRLKDPENARQVRVQITEAGLEKLHSVEGTPDGDQEGFDPLACLTEAEQATLRELLKKMSHHMKKIK